MRWQRFNRDAPTGAAVGHGADGDGQPLGALAQPGSVPAFRLRSCSILQGMQILHEHNLVAQLAEFARM
jgi:hypothetical protein